MSLHMGIKKPGIHGFRIKEQAGLLRTHPAAEGKRRLHKGIKVLPPCAVVRVPNPQVKLSI